MNGIKSEFSAKEQKKTFKQLVNINNLLTVWSRVLFEKLIFSSASQEIHRILWSMVVCY